MTDSEPSSKSKQVNATKKKQGQGKNSILFTNLLLIVAIGLVLFASQTIKQELTKTQQIFEKQANAELNKQPVRPASSKKNVMCPNARADLDSCYQKKAKCAQTQKEFQSAEKQFNKLITDCAKSNDQNQKMNDQMEKQVIQMENDLSQAEKIM